MTIGHEWKGSTEPRDEQILMICVMDGNRSSAYELGRVFPPFQKGDTVIEQQYGSLKTQLFLRVDNIINKPLRTAPGAWMMEIDRQPRGTHMRQIMVALNDDEYLRTMAIIRMDPDRRNPEFDKWCILMLSKGRSHEPYREIGPVLMREKSIVSPTKRLSSLGRIGFKLGRPRTRAIFASSMTLKPPAVSRERDIHPHPVWKGKGLLTTPLAPSPQRKPKDQVPHQVNQALPHLITPIPRLLKRRRDL